MVHFSSSSSRERAWGRIRGILKGMTDTGTLHNYTEMESEIRDFCQALSDGLGTRIAFDTSVRSRL